MNQDYSPLHAACQSYLDAILAGDKNLAHQVILGELQSGTMPMDAYLHILVPAQRRIGELWLNGDLSIANEHMATEITTLEMELLRGIANRKPSINRKVLVATAPGERHSLGARIVSDFLYINGWDVDFLGTDIPADELGIFAKERKPDVIALSIVLSENINGAKEAIAMVKQYAPTIPIMIGGPGVNGEDQVKELGADGFAADASAAVRTARDLAGIGQAESLEQALAELGSRIQAARRAVNWNQQNLAESAGMDRTYISALENGKQNLTISALLKIANALDVPASSLIPD